MRVNLTTTVSTDIEDVQTLIAVCYNQAQRLEGSYKTLSFAQGSYYAVLEVKDITANIIILGTNSIFLFKPRYDTDTYSTSYTLYNNKTATLALDESINVWESDPALPPLENFSSDLQYGNVDWKGLPIEDGISRILSWVGPPGRSIPVGTTEVIEGLSVPDISFGETDFFTVFRSNIYENGSIAYTAPVVGDIEPKVVGCAYQGNTLICIVNNHYADRQGFFEEVWINNGDPKLANPDAQNDSDKHPNGWVKLNELQRGRPTQCWFFNASGTQATQGVALYTIDVKNKTVLYDGGDNTWLEVVYTKDADTGIHKTEYSGTTTVWSDFKGDERIFARITASGGRTFDSNIDEVGREKSEQVYIIGERYEPEWIEGPGSAYVGAAFSYRGVGDKCCEESVEWSFSNGSISDSGVITSISGGCGMGNVTATRCGASISVPVRLPSGSWILESVVGTYTGVDPPGEYISGDTKIMEYYTCACGLTATFVYKCSWLNGAGCCREQFTESLTLYGANMYPIGPPQVPTLDARCLSQEISCGDGKTITSSYTACTGCYIDQNASCNPSGSKGVLTTHSYTAPTGFAKASPQRREIYRWECPP